MATKTFWELRHDGLAIHVFLTQSDAIRWLHKHTLFSLAEACNEGYELVRIEADPMG